MRVYFFASLLIPFLGFAGVYGFWGFNNDHFRNRFFKSRQHVLTEEFLAQYWIPLLLSEGPIPIIDERSKFLAGPNQAIPESLLGLLFTLLMFAPLIVLLHWMKNIQGFNSSLVLFSGLIGLRLIIVVLGAWLRMLRKRKHSQKFDQSLFKKYEDGKSELERHGINS